MKTENNIINKERITQLSNRVLKLRLNHEKLHSSAFPKDKSKGHYEIHRDKVHKWYQKNKEYIKIQQKKDAGFDYVKMKGYPGDWSQTSLSKLLNKSNRITDTIQREILALMYYNHIMTTKQGVFSLIDETHDEYGRPSLFSYDKMNMEPLFPKTKDEIAEKQKFDNATYLEQLNMKKIDYEVSSKKANDDCHKLVISVCKKICSNKKVNKETIENQIYKGIHKIAQHCPIVEDKESIRAIESPINVALEKENYGFEINVYDKA